MSKLFPNMRYLNCGHIEKNIPAFRCSKCGGKKVLAEDSYLFKAPDTTTKEGMEQAKKTESSIWWLIIIAIIIIIIMFIVLEINAWSRI